MASAAGSKMAPVAEKAKPAVSAISGKAKAIAGSGVVRYATRGPRAYLSHQKAYAQGHLRLAKAVGGFVKDVKRANRTFEENTREHRQKLAEADLEYDKQSGSGAAHMKLGVTPTQVGEAISGGLIGAYIGTGIAGSFRHAVEEALYHTGHSSGVASALTDHIDKTVTGSAALLGATACVHIIRNLERERKWQQTSEGKESCSQTKQAYVEYDTAVRPLKEERAQAIKGAAKNLFSEVKGARRDILGGQKAAWRTILGKA